MTADPGFLADPYPVFAELRERGPAHWHHGLGVYLAVTHPACDALLRDRSMGRIWRGSAGRTFAASSSWPSGVPF